MIPTVLKNGIKDCLKQCRMETSYNTMSDGFSFHTVTNKIEYVVSIENNISVGTYVYHMGRETYAIH